MSNMLWLVSWSKDPFSWFGSFGQDPLDIIWKVVIIIIVTLIIIIIVIVIAITTTSYYCHYYFGNRYLGF